MTANVKNRGPGAGLQLESAVLPPSSCLDLGEVVMKALLVNWLTAWAETPQLKRQILASWQVVSRPLPDHLRPSMLASGGSEEAEDPVDPANVVIAGEVVESSSESEAGQEDEAVLPPSIARAAALGLRARR